MTTTDTAPEPVDASAYDDATLVNQIAMLRGAVADTYKLLRPLEHELDIRMREDDAKVMPHAAFEVVRKPNTSTEYDVNLVRAHVVEMLDALDLDKLILPAEEKTVTTPERVDGRFALKVRKYGDKFGAALDKAVLPRTYKIEITKKKGTGA